MEQRVQLVDEVLLKETPAHKEPYFVLDSPLQHRLLHYKLQLAKLGTLRPSTEGFNFRPLTQSMPVGYFYSRWIRLIIVL